jgi:hypothetical protein
MGNVKDLSGHRFGRLTVIKREGNNKCGSALWLCKCECGNAKIVIAANLVAKNVKSCGCLRTLHGYHTEPTYRSWQAMIQRCTNPNHSAYKRYGNKGVTVCQEWIDDFRNFLNDMGERHEGKTLDRIDNDKGYSKENCRWATTKDQGFNRKNGVMKSWDQNEWPYERSSVIKFLKLGMDRSQIISHAENTIKLKSSSHWRRIEERMKYLKAN